MTILRRLRAAAAAFAAPPLVYGGTGTIHRTGHVDVELSPTGRVVAVWFRCMRLPFEETVIDVNRAVEMTQLYEHAAPPQIDSVTFGGQR